MSSPYKAYIADDGGASPRRGYHGGGAGGGGGGGFHDELRELNSMMSGAGGSPSRDALGGSQFRSSDYVRPLTGGASAMPQSNSRAVISALKALQDKIRKLEQERAYYEDNASVLSREKDQYREQLAAERSAVQKAQAEQELVIKRQRIEMESSLTHTQAQLDRMRAELDEVNRRVRETEQAKSRAERALTDAEERAAQIAHHAATEAARSSQRLHELEASQDRMRIETENRLREIQQSMFEERTQRRAAIASEVKTKEALRQVLDVNETLVERVLETEAEEAAAEEAAAAAAAELDAARGYESTPGSARRAAAAAAAAEARRERPVSAVRRRSEATRTSAGGRSQQQRRPRTAPKGSGSGSASGRPRLPFVVGKNPGKSFSLTANAQQAYTLLQELQPMAEALNASSASGHGHGGHGHGHNHSHSHGGGGGGASSSNVSSEFYLTHADLDFVVSALEGELSGLTDRYQGLKRELQSLQSTTPVEALNNALRETIEAMEAKGDQIKSLKRYKRGMQRTLDTTHFQLERYRRLLEEESRSKATPLKVLRGIQQLQLQLRGEARL